MVNCGPKDVELGDLTLLRGREMMLKVPVMPMPQSQVITMAAKSKLNFCTYNIHGAQNCNWDYVNHLMKKHDFMLVQELWLGSSQAGFINQKMPDVSFHFISGMPDDVFCRGRPYGGCAIVWSAKSQYCVEPLRCLSTRACCVKISCSSFSSLVFSVYMPCDGGRESADEYYEVLHAILATVSSVDVDFVVCAGDLNTDLSRNNSLNTLHLLNFLSNENFSLVDSLPSFRVAYTYESAINGSRSAIDHFMVRGLDISDSVLGVEALDDPDNMSDHLVVSLSIATPPEPPRPQNAPNEASRQDRPQWDHATAMDLTSYREGLDAKLRLFELPAEVTQCRNYSCKEHTEVLQRYYDHVVRSMVALWLLLLMSSCQRGPIVGVVCRDGQSLYSPIVSELCFGTISGKQMVPRGMGCLRTFVEPLARSTISLFVELKS
jgi:hypothetical protein